MWLYNFLKALFFMLHYVKCQMHQATKCYCDCQKKKIMEKTPHIPPEKIIIFWKINQNPIKNWADCSVYVVWRWTKLEAEWMNIKKANENAIDYQILWVIQCHKSLFFVIFVSRSLFWHKALPNNQSYFEWNAVTKFMSARRKLWKLKTVYCQEESNARVSE